MTGPGDICSCCRKCGAVAPCASSLAGDCDGICFCGLPWAEGDEAGGLRDGPEPVDGDEILARRLVACPGFRPMPGMLDVKGWRVAHVGGGTIEWHDTEWNRPVEPDRIMPDLDDPATRGCIECGLLPELYRDDRAHLWRSVDGRWHWGPSAISWASGATRVEALVAALESAPERG